jgi:hypothetical protein
MNIFDDYTNSLLTQLNQNRLSNSLFQPSCLSTLQRIITEGLGGHLNISISF